MTLGLISVTARGRAARRAAVASVVVAAVVYGVVHPGGSLRPMPDAVAARAATPTSAQAASWMAWHRNVGATHSPRVERLLAGRTGAPTAAAKAAAAVPAGEALGVDVSSFNHPGGAPIEWAQVAAAGYKFAFIKATEGSYYENPYYASDAAAARAAGLFTAAYHFAIPNNSSGTLQADLAVDAAGDPASGGTTLPLILDAEYDPYVSSDGTNECYGLSPAVMVAWIGAFNGEVTRRTGQPPAIYTTSDWWKTCTGNSGVFGADPLWIASSVKPASVPPSWKAFTYWQFTSTKTVPGISTGTDASYFSPATLAAAQPAVQSYPAGATVSLAMRSLAATAGNTISYSAPALQSLAIDPQTGVISGQLPSAPESFPVTVSLAGPAGQGQNLAFTWHVHGAVRLVWPGRQASRAGSTVNLRLTALDGLTGCSLTFAASGLPPGLTMDACGRITGIPYRPGSYQPTVTVTDSGNLALATTTFRWTISSPAVVTAGKIRLALGGTAMCLADLPGSAGPTAKVWSCRTSAGQSWRLTKNGTIRQGGRCLAAVTLADGTPAVALRFCTNRTAQIWQQVAQGGLASAQTGQCLTEPKISPPDGTAVTLAGCAGIGRQAWTLPRGPLAPGVAGQCLAEVPGTAGHPAHVVLTRCRTAPSQNWVITPAGTIASGRLCLDAGTAPAAGMPVTLTICGARPGQQWQPLPALATTGSTVASTTGGAGTFLVNPAAGLCLDAVASRTATSPLTLAYCSIGYPRQTWRTS